MNEYKTTDEYIGNFSGGAKTYLETARRTILALDPEMKEKISYGFPTFELHGKNIVHIAAYENHYAFYPGGIVTQFVDELKDYKTSKGTVQFPLDKPVPYELIAEITKAAVARRQK